ncbi:hypothetical protein OU415_36190 [Saccharopolyspora sp. WRP15-2]|uniref:Uncharacterized protein n=1 Tax=Saccharopolyspora oryzae TaxID=2997343 RepID=A0ABT4VAD1_9PSEU|nr:hypothetical protein [Saccharopolyspora oryzae]MDA3630913.1 hypothetical protein [Saccharopolyspora oryzae]
MSRRDRTTGAARQWRLLSRALVVVGATVAGTSAAWLLDHGPADAADLPAAEAEAEHTAGDAPAGESGPEEFSLTRLDPIKLVNSGPTGKLLDAAQPVTEVLQQPAAEVGQVAGDALAVTTQTTSPDTAAEPESAQPPQQPVEADRTPHVEPPAADVAVESPVPDVAEPASEPRPAEPQRFSPPEPPAPEPPAQPRLPIGATPFVLPSTPGAPGCGGATDGPHHNTTALGWHPAAPVRAPARAGAPSCDIEATLLPSVAEPQPGTTPD